jgi:ferric-dicitrate binding protein FerR (iron transport regulator)
MLLKFGFVFLLTLVSASVWAQGQVTFIKGQFSALKLNAKKSQPQELALKAKLLPGHSYYTHELSHAVVRLPDGAWVRVGSETKFELISHKDHFEVFLQSGTLRVLFAPKLTKGQSKRLVIRTEEASIETSSAKFTVTYMPLFGHTSVYVDKGVAQLSKRGEGQVPVLVHGGEFSEFVLNDAHPKESKTMDERQQTMLKSLLFSQLKKDAP